MRATQTRRRRLRRLDCHAGQKRVRASKIRHRIIRCGRRWGKTEFLIDETVRAVLHHKKVGWFIAQFQYIDEVWERLCEALEPWILKKNDSKHRITVIGGGSVEVWSFESNKNAGRGRKYHRIFIDEAGLIPGLLRWWQAVGEATLIDFRGRAILVSTPNVIGPDFDTIADGAGKEGYEDWECFTGATFDNQYLPRESLERIRQRRKSMPDWIWCQEYLGIPADQAKGFFGRQMLKAHAAEHVTDPLRRVRLDVPGGFRGLSTLKKIDVEVLEDPHRGAWRLWFEGDPDPNHQFVIGIDVGAGVGSSNTVFSVFNLTTRRKVAEFADAGVGSETAAEIAMIAGVWFNGATICPEVNGGQGQSFARKLMRNAYPAIFSAREGQARRDHNDEKSTLEVGWTSNPERKKAMLEEYRAALSAGDFINPSEAAIDEAETYDYDRAGKLVPFRRDADPTQDIARRPHGDRVIADGLAWHVALHIAQRRPAKEVKPAPGSDHERFEKRRKALARDKNKRSRSLW